MCNDLTAERERAVANKTVLCLYAGKHTDRGVVEGTLRSQGQFAESMNALSRGGQKQSWLLGKIRLKYCGK